MVNGWRVEVRNADLEVVGQCDVWTSLGVTLRHRAAGGWSLSMPAGHEQAALFTEGSGIIVWAPWSITTPLLSGPVTRLTATTPGSTESAVLTVDGVDDTALLADRIVLPDPTSDPDDQGATAYYTVSGAAEGVIRTLVDVNAGASALTGRRLCDADPDNRLASPGSLFGSTRNVTARFDNLLALCGEVASTDNLAVRLYQPAGITDRYLEVLETTDRTASVRLSQPAGTLTSATAVLAAPSATNVLVAGGGEEEARVLVERTDAALIAAWGRRVEVFRDARDTSDLTELAERGDETLAEAAATAGITVEPADLPSRGFGVDYALGDTVTVEVGGVTYTEIVTGVQVDVTAGGGTVTRPTVGDTDTADGRTPVIYSRVRELTRRLEALERRQ